MSQDIIQNTKEVFKEGSKALQDRMYSPMYLFFFFAWVTTNWKFVYVLLFQTEDSILEKTGMLKIDYLSQMYSIEWLWPLVITCGMLILIPFIFSAAAVWIFSNISVHFFERHYQYLKDKEYAKRKVEYRNEIAAKAEKFEIRKKEVASAQRVSDHIEYEQKSSFNEIYDEERENITIDGVDYLPSQVLYDTDRDRYEEEYLKYLNDKEEAVQNLIHSGSYANTHAAVAQLEKYKENLDGSQAYAIFDSLDSNAQIIADEDVVALIKAIYDNHKEDVSEDMQGMIEKFIQ